MRAVVLAAILAVTVGCGRLGFEAPDGGGAGDDGDGGGGDGGGPGDGGADAPTDGVTVTCGTQMMCAETSRSFIAGVTGMITDDGTTTGDATQGSCGGGGAGDFGVQFTVTPVGLGRVTWRVDAAFDTVLYVFNGMGCSGMELACEDVPGASGETFQLDLFTFPRTIVLVVDGKSGACGPITISWGP